MVISHDVDICVTCVTDKPPKLPLREELVSLGVEVIYKAAGVGLNAARHEAKRKVKEFREYVQKESIESQRCTESSETPEEEVRNRISNRAIEKEIFQERTSISYEAYTQRLSRQNSVDSDSLSSLDSAFGISCKAGAFAFNSDRSFGVAQEERDGAVSPVRARQDDRDQENSPLETIRGEESADTQSKQSLDPLVKSYSISHTKCDHESIESTYEKETEKALVSASGNRWWYEQIDHHSVEPLQEASCENASVHHGSSPSRPILPVDFGRVAQSIPGAHEKEQESGKTCPSCHSPLVHDLCSCGDNESTLEGVDEVSTRQPLETTMDTIQSILEPVSTAERESGRNGSWFSCDFTEICGGWRHVQSDATDETTLLKNCTISSDSTDIISNKSVGIDKNKSHCQLIEENVDRSHFSCDEECGGEISVKMSDSLEPSNSSASPESRYQDIISSPSKPSTLSRQITMPNEGPSINEGQISKRQLFALLSQAVVPITELQGLLRKAPALARVMTLFNGQNALHSACDRNLPDRFSDRSVTLVKRALDQLISDIVDWRSVVSTVLVFNEDGCKALDKNGDLPVHLAARRLIEWEGHWQTRLSGISVLEDVDVIKVDRLYHEMSQTVGMLIEPILSLRSLCQKGGRVGRMLPLHIACIFSVESEKALKLLRTFSEAAGVKCSLGDLLTLIEDNLYPLELLDRKRSVGSKVNASQLSAHEKLEESFLSDALFAFYPNIEPFRSDPKRLSRMELKVKTAACNLRKWNEIGGCPDMDSAARSIWIWFCTQDAEVGTGHYSKNVANIVEGLTLEEVKLLAYLKTDSGNAVSVASRECQSILNSRLLDGDSSEMSPMDGESKSLLVDSLLTSSMPTKNITTNFILGSMLKKCFNVKENAHPSTFIILPYKLVAQENGSLALDDPASASKAIEFAKYLLEVTHPKYLVHQLEKKAMQHAVLKVPANEMEQWILTEEKHRIIQQEFMSIYRAGPGYMYLLDEIDSTPVTRGGLGEKFYPIRIEDPAETVRRMLPLMLMGMIHMRGHKSLSTFANTIVEGGEHMPAPWVETAEAILQLLSSGTTVQSTLIASAMSCRDDLERIVYAMNGRRSQQQRSSTTEDGCEWVVELTLLKLILERSDIRRSFAGLSRISIANGDVVWTKCKVEILVDHGTNVYDNHRNFPITSRFTMEPQEDTKSFVVTQCEEAVEKDAKVATNNTTQSLSLCDSQSSANARPTSFVSRVSSTRSSDSSLSNGSCDNFSLGESGRIGTLAHSESSHEKTETYLAPSAKVDAELALYYNLPSNVPSQQNSAANESAVTIGSFQCMLQTDQKKERKIELIWKKRSAFDVLDDDQISCGSGPFSNDLSHLLSSYDENAAQWCSDDIGVDILKLEVRHDPTKTLLLRLSLLEKHLLDREIDLEQIKLELQNFELEAECRSHLWNIY